MSVSDAGGTLHAIDLPRTITITDKDGVQHEHNVPIPLTVYQLADIPREEIDIIGTH